MWQFPPILRKLLKTCELVVLSILSIYCMIIVKPRSRSGYQNRIIPSVSDPYRPIYWIRIRIQTKIYYYKKEKIHNWNSIKKTSPDTRTKGVQTHLFPFSEGQFLPVWIWLNPDPVRIRIRYTDYSNDVTEHGEGTYPDVEALLDLLGGDELDVALLVVVDLHLEQARHFSHLTAGRQLHRPLGPPPSVPGQSKFSWHRPFLDNQNSHDTVRSWTIKILMTPSVPGQSKFWRSKILMTPSVPGQDNQNSHDIVRSWTIKISLMRTREMENISRGHTFGDFVPIRTETSLQDVTVARLQSTRVPTPLSPLF